MFRHSSGKVLYNNNPNNVFLLIGSYLPFCVSLTEFEVAEESPSLPSDSEHGMPEVDPEAGTPVAGSDTVEEIPRVEIPSSAAPIGKSSFVFLPTGHDMSSRPTEKGESSSGPSLQFAKKVLVRVLSSWIETLHSGHLDARFGMIPHVKEILTDTEEVGLDVTGARAIVDRIIVL
ncbi:hypothetical protein, partial [Streptomyces plicatus]|uniref:hypothetical protein n=1 Tax=Streptomyces plicatus TaxID=1922 RepID=UPI001875FBE6